MTSLQSLKKNKHPKNDSYRNALNSWLNSITQLGDKDFWKPVASFAQSGKQLRPELIRGLVLSANQKFSNKIIQDAAALELIHVSTLIHDDIIDQSKFRRKHKTINARFGDNIALFIGNLIKDHALSIASPAAVPHLNLASRDVNLGQMWETLARNEERITVTDYFTISLFKTARIFRHSAQVAALHIGRKFSESSLCALELLALAYQALDDWRDLGEDSNTMGKTVGLDKQNNVHSFVYAYWPKNPKEKRNPISFVKTNDSTLSQVAMCLSKMKRRPPSNKKLSEISLKDSAAVLREFCENISARAKLLASKDKVVLCVTETFSAHLMKDVADICNEAKI